MARGITSSTEIKKLLKQKFGDTVKFSVTQSVFSGGSSITVSIISGSIPAYASEVPKYGTEFSTWSYAEDNELYTPEFKKVIKEVIRITESVYMPNRHSQFVHYRTGSYNAPYEFIQKKSYEKSTSTGGFFGDLITECAGWWIMLKKMGDGRSVYNIVKKKETKPNKGDWNQIRGEIYIEGGFKWSPKTQTFQKWGGDLSKEDIDKICKILRKYYVDDSPAPEQKPTSTFPEADKDLMDSFVNEMMEEEFKALQVSNATTSELYENKIKQSKFIKYLIERVDLFLKQTVYKKILDYNIKDVQYIYKKLADINYHTLNNFLGLYGFYGESLRQDYINDYEQFPDSYLVPFETEKKPQKKSKEEIIRAIEGLEILAESGNEKAQKAIIGLRILLENA
jgi:hypothetical protein